MKRREFFSVIGGAAAAWPLAAGAQTGKLSTVGYLAGGSEVASRPVRAAFVQRLAELGWIEGRSVRIEYRWADGAVKRAIEIAPELIRLPVDVIVTGGDAYVIAVKSATATIPIVFFAAGDSVGNGLVESLARPGGNVTGLSLQLTETVGKRLELLREVVPALHRLAILFNAADKQVDLELDAAQAAVRALSLDVIRSEIRPGEDISPAVEQLKGQADALYVCLDPLSRTRRASIRERTSFRGQGALHIADASLVAED
jgi:putative ABC transport system substrate-binding protein